MINQGGYAGGGAFTCSACMESFPTGAEQRQHHKSERHMYNTKRRLANLNPISQQVWDKKMEQLAAASAAQVAKGSAHLKKDKLAKKKEERRSRANSDGTSPTGDEQTCPPCQKPAAPVEPFTPCHCLFDARKFSTVEENLEYMQKKYNFIIPNKEYLVELEALLKYLEEKIREQHACLFCNRRFTDKNATMQHMLDKNHTRIGTETLTRRGNYDPEGTESIQAELEDFYDYRTSIKEINKKQKKKANVAALTEKAHHPGGSEDDASEDIDDLRKVKRIMSIFDDDRDGKLNFKEATALRSCTNPDAEFAEEKQYKDACSLTGSDPETGLDVEALAKLYQALGTLASDHEKVVAAQKEKKKDGSSAKVEAEADEEEEDEDDYDEDEDGDDDDLEIIECEDEEEFAQVIAQYGLQRAEILPSGNLRLPDGTEAAHRGLRYIYRQRGMRKGPAAEGQGVAKALPLWGSRKAMAMITNGGPGSAFALSSRQHNRMGKQILAVLKAQNKWEMRQGLKQNLLQLKRVCGTRSVRGDASGAGGRGR